VVSVVWVTGGRVLVVGLRLRRQLDQLRRENPGLVDGKIALEHILKSIAQDGAA
jgi:hypothetical protein